MGSNSGQKMLWIMYNSASLAALTAPIIIGQTLLIAGFFNVIVNYTIIASVCMQLLIFIITWYKCY